MTAAEMEWHRYAVAHLESLDVTSHSYDGPSEFVTWNARESQINPDPRPIALPQVPVAPAYSTRLGFNDGIAGPWYRVWKILDFQRLSELSNHRPSHVSSLPLSSSGARCRPRVPRSRPSTPRYERVCEPSPFWVSEQLPDGQPLSEFLRSVSLGTPHKLETRFRVQPDPPSTRPSAFAKEAPEDRAQMRSLPSCPMPHAPLDRRADRLRSLHSCVTERRRRLTVAIASLRTENIRSLRMES